MIVEFILILYIQRQPYGEQGETITFERFLDKNECVRIGQASKELHKGVQFSCAPVLKLLIK